LEEKALDPKSRLKRKKIALSLSYTGKRRLSIFNSYIWSPANTFY